MTVDEASCSSLWSKEQDKAFENAIATYPEDDLDRWDKIASAVAGKTMDEIKHHYELLVDDINQIEAGCVPLPTYSSSEGSSSHGGNEGISGHGSKASRAEQERRKGIAWTEEEHRLFLLGLEKYGKGDWRSISRNFVVTRTPTQVASHAQKYFIRLNSMNKDRRRSSIHDITSVGNADVATPPGPITGQANGAGPSAKASKQPAGVGMYGAAVGTPVNVSGAGHMAYGVRAPVNMGHMTYPTTAHR